MLFFQSLCEKQSQLTKVWREHLQSKGQVGVACSLKSDDLLDKCLKLSVVLHISITDQETVYIKQYYTFPLSGNEQVNHQLGYITRLS